MRASALAAFAVLVLLLAAAVAGCGGDDEAAPTTTTETTPPPPDYPDDPGAREVLDRFVQAAGTQDISTMWSLLDAPTQARYGPTEAAFAAASGNDLALVLGGFARDGGTYEHVLAKRVTDEWSVAAITGSVSLEGTEEFGAYAVVVTDESGKDLISLAGTVTFNPVAPEPELVSGATPSIATELSASEPVLRTVIWVDDTPATSELAPDAILLTGEPTVPLEPGRHTIVTYADTQSGAGANAFSFASD